jgi:hypothetical protein
MDTKQMTAGKLAEIRNNREERKTKPRRATSKGDKSGKRRNAGQDRN